MQGYRGFGRKIQIQVFKGNTLSASADPNINLQGAIYTLIIEEVINYLTQMRSLCQISLFLSRIVDPSVSSKHLLKDINDLRNYGNYQLKSIKSNKQIQYLGNRLCFSII